MWTYRVVRQVHPDGVTFGIHEAYDDGNIEQPHSISVDPCAPVGETVEELTASLDRMKAAFDKAVLEYVVFAHGHLRMPKNDSVREP